MRASTGLFAIGALALGCRTIPAREAPAPTARQPAAPGECATVPAQSAPPRAAEPLVVTATAYNSLRSQGSGRGRHGAWGDRLAPGMKTIAVSHDLIALGLERGAVVRIEGLAGDYVVLDRLPRRWKRRIDIYMGHDVRAARAWGRREARIHPVERIADDAPAAAPLD